MNNFAGFFLIILFLSCSAEECIQCNNINNYPNTTICEDTYNTTKQLGTQSWQIYKEEALENGCTEKN